MCEIPGIISGDNAVKTLKEKIDGLTGHVAMISNSIATLDKTCHYDLEKSIADLDYRAQDVIRIIDQRVSAEHVDTWIRMIKKMFIDAVEQCNGKIDDRVHTPDMSQFTVFSDLNIFSHNQHVVTVADRLHQIGMNLFTVHPYCSKDKKICRYVIRPDEDVFGDRYAYDYQFFEDRTIVITIDCQLNSIYGVTFGTIV